MASISLEDAEYLKRLQQRRGPVRLRLVLDSRTETKESWNVVGELTGAEHPQEILVCGAHYDTWHVGPGAIDNAAGVVAVVEAARALAMHREHLRRTVRFVAFGVEESGLVGSWAYTQRHAGELDDTWLMINNDVGGRPSGLGIAGAEDLLPTLETVASRVRVDGLEKPFGASCGTTSWGSDHFPFFAHGVPTVGLGTESVWPEDRFYGHSRADTADKVYPQGPERVRGDQRAGAVRGGQPRRASGAAAHAGGVGSLICRYAAGGGCRTTRLVAAGAGVGEVFREGMKRLLSPSLD